MTPKQLTTHHARVMATAADVLTKFHTGKGNFTSENFGQATRSRGGKRRIVCYLEVTDGSGPTLCIEVYTK